MTTATTPAIVGECQVCGRTQKLVRGMLANHGYTRARLAQYGTCPGARYLPASTGDVTSIDKAIERERWHLGP